MESQVERFPAVICWHAYILTPYNEKGKNAIEATRKVALHP